MRTIRRLRRSVALLLLVTCLPACFHYVTPTKTTPQEYIAANHPKQVRVTLADQSWHVLRDPWVAGDTLGGLVTMFGTSGLYASAPAAGVPLDSVERFEVHQPNAVLTVALVTLAVAAIGGAIGAAVALNNWEFMGR